MSDIHQYEPLWGAWHVEGLIGEGSFGKVYKIRRAEFGKTYFSAVKLITIPQGSADLRQMRSEGMDKASARSYFHAFVADIVQEIHMLSEFRGNSHIVSFEDHKVIEKTGEFGWDILIRMELLKSLTDYAMERTLSPAEVVKLGIHICRALELCARRQIIHRDIKPDNIFISQYGDYKLGDFGIARQVERTMSGLSKKGTYTYMAPEVFRGDEYGPTVDIYSLGIVMYRFLNGNRTPFLPDFPAPMTLADREAAQQRRMQGEALPLPKDGSAALKAAVLKACAYNSKDRFASAAEMRMALEAIVGERRGDTSAAVEATAMLEGTENTVGVLADTHRESVATSEEQTNATVGVFGDDPILGAAAPIATSPNTSSQNLKWPSVILAAFILSAIMLGFWFGNRLENLSATPGAITSPSTITIKDQQYSTNLTELDLSSQELTNADLEPLKYMTNLKSLNLGDNPISDISILSGLTNLTALYLWDNELSDISPLSRLTNLKRLDLYSNPISDISVLSELTNLTVLALRGGKVSDLSALSGLTSLTWLYVDSAQISDISALSGLTNLTQLYLFLEDSEISDISALSMLTNLMELNLCGNQIHDINALSGLKNLAELYLRSTQISDINALSELTNLKGLTLIGSQVSDISALRGLVKLTFVDLRDNPISDWSPVDHVKDVYGRP